MIVMLTTVMTIKNRRRMTITMMMAKNVDDDNVSVIRLNNDYSWLIYEKLTNTNTMRPSRPLFFVFWETLMQNYDWRTANYIPYINQYTPIPNA